MREVHSEIEINASPEQVWQVLTDFERYNEWNPYIVQASATLAAGQDIRMTLKLYDGKEKSTKRMLTIVKPNQELRWQGFTYFGGLIDREQNFKIEEIETNKVRFSQREQFQGLIVPFIWKNTSVSTRAGFDAMNKALKERVEGQKI